ncbi:hypothetical protein [Nocardia alni]|uniref:hypothetical protein n=1 Tax=Nocardia alni TaxID=2815723 RepID=UPI001C21C583|nr:hypothetical protein [Nocardia alni]
MSEQEFITRHDSAPHAELRLFCQLMLGSADAADRLMHQIYHDQQENWPAERIGLFRIAADLCGARPEDRNRYCVGPGDDIGGE